MTRPLLAFLKQGCLWELMCTKIKNKFVSNLKKFIQIFFQVDQFSIKENWKSLWIKILFSQKKYLLSFCFWSSDRSLFNLLLRIFCKKKKQLSKKRRKNFFVFIFFVVSQIKKLNFFWSMHRSKRIKKRMNKHSIEKKIEQEK